MTLLEESRVSLRTAVLAVFFVASVIFGGQAIVARAVEGHEEKPHEGTASSSELQDLGEQVQAIHTQQAVIRRDVQQNGRALRAIAGKLNVIVPPTHSID